MSSDYWVEIARWAGLCALALTVIIALQIVDMRRASRRRQARDEAMRRTWRPVLNAALMGDLPQQLPALAKRDMTAFLVLWLHLHQSVRGSAGDALNTIARRLGCDLLARRLLARGSRAQQVVATLVLGHMADRAAWPALLRHARQLDSAASILALWALVRIDADAAARELAPTLLQRADWPLAQLATILQPQRAAWEPALAAAIGTAAPQRLPNVLRLMAALRLELPPQTLDRMLAHPDADVVAAALRLATGPHAADRIRSHLAHPSWQVRVQAVRALGPIAGHGDVARLQALLADPEWWVRYRAAQALAALPFLGKAELASLSANDRFAADIMRQVLAERANA